MSEAATTLIPPSNSIAVGYDPTDYTRTEITANVKRYDGCLWIDPVDQSSPSFIRGPLSRLPTLALVKCNTLTGEVASIAYSYLGGDQSIRERLVDIPYKGGAPTESCHSSISFDQTVRTDGHNGDDDGDPPSDNFSVRNPTMYPSGHDDYRDSQEHDTQSDDSRPNEIHVQGDIAIINPRKIISYFDPDLVQVLLPINPTIDRQASTSQATVYRCSHLLEITAPFVPPAIDGDWLPNAIVPPDNPGSLLDWQKALGGRLQRRRMYGNGDINSEGVMTS
jgi:hypothetical protein